MQTIQQLDTPFEPRGLPEQYVHRMLIERLTNDLTFNSGRIVGSMCTPPHPTARRIFLRHLEKNLGDAGLFPGTAQLEAEAVRALGKLLGSRDAVGHIVSGGTEANIIALWAARNLSRGKKEVILSTSAHFSFDKAADLLGLELKKIPVTSEFQISLERVRESIGKKTLAIVGIAGTTDVGAIDPIRELSDIALENDVFLHVDASFGGFVIPFLRSLGIQPPTFDFRAEGVQSITIDPHKMGLAPVPAGCIIMRDASIQHAISRKIPYLSGGEIHQSTVLGTRSGAAAIAVWAVLHSLGMEGYVKIVACCMSRTMELASEIAKMRELKLMAQPTLNIVAIGSDTMDINEVARELRHKGWAIGVFPRHIRIVIMPHVRTIHLKRFLRDLKAVTASLTS